MGAEWRFGDAAPHEKLMRRAHMHEREAEGAVSKQHVVSRTLLKRFAAPTAKGHKLIPHHVEYGPQRPVSVRECAKASDLIRVASASAERRWASVEDRLPMAIDATLAGGVHKSQQHVRTIKDAMALHYVRSYRYLEAHVAAFVEAETQVRGELLRDRKPMLVDAFRRKTGLEPVGTGALDFVMEPAFELWRQVEAAGAYTRASIEDTFERVRECFNQVPLEIGHVTIGHPLLISDSPAVPVRFEPTTQTFEIDVALGDANTLVLPLTPTCVAALGARDVEAPLPEGIVRVLNEAQLLAAREYLYYAPGSRLGALASTWLKSHPRPVRSMARPRGMSQQNQPRSRTAIQS